MQVVKSWTDRDTMGAALYDDGHRFVFDEKGAALVAPDGTIVSVWWKEEPSGQHYEAYVKDCDAPVGVVDLDDKMKEAIYEVCHYNGEVANIAARKLTALLLG